MNSSFSDFFTCFLCRAATDSKSFTNIRYICKVIRETIIASLFPVASSFERPQSFPMRRTVLGI